MEVKIPTLVQIDLSLKRDSHHPDIKEGAFYLAKIEGYWYAGTFSLQHYGWNFDAVYDAGFQMSWTGWELLYEIVEEAI